MTLIPYTRSYEVGGRLAYIEDKKKLPKKVKFYGHSIQRAQERAEWVENTEERLIEWIKHAEYLGRWSKHEGWGDDEYVAIGLRRSGELHITTFEPRVYWDYDVSQYKAMMDKITGEDTGDLQ